MAYMVGRESSGRLCGIAGMCYGNEGLPKTNPRTPSKIVTDAPAHVAAWLGRLRAPQPRCHPLLRPRQRRGAKVSQGLREALLGVGGAVGCDGERVDALEARL